MVYETDFYTSRRPYSSRPVVSSYSVAYPVSRTFNGSSRVYTASYPIYSYSPRITQKRVISSPVRTIYSTPIVRTRIISSPIRTTRVYSSPVRTTTRVISSPVRTTTTTRVYSSSDYNLPYTSLYSAPYRTTRVIESPVRVYTTSRLYSPSLTPERVITTPIRTLPSVLNKEYDRIANRVRPGYGYSQLNNYLNSEPYINFEEETKRIRNSTQNLMRELHAPVVRRSRSVTPFPAYSYEPTSKLTLDSYVARMTNPTRHLAKDVHNITQYPEAPRKYVGKSHLASIQIRGNKAYNTRNSLYDSDKVRTDINLRSHYIQRQLGKNAQGTEKVVVSNGVPDLDPFRPSRRFSAPISLDDPVEEETKEKQRLRKERLMTVNEEASIDDVAIEKKKAQRNDEVKRLEAKALEEEKKRKAEAERRAKLEADKLAEEQKKADEEARKAREARLAEQARLAEEAKQAEQARLAEEAKLAEEARLADEARQAEAAKLAEEAKLAEQARLAEEARLAAEAKQAEEARLAEEARKAEEQRLAEEQKTREEEMSRLAELEKIAGEEREAELARQAAELAEIARQEAEIAAQELQAMQQSSTAEEPAAEEPAAEEAVPTADAEPTIDETAVEEESKPVVEEPQSPLEETQGEELAAEPSVSIDEVKSDVEE